MDQIRVVQPYLYFEGRCDEAIAFYQQKLGATLMMLMRYGQMPGGREPGMNPLPPADKVMHATLRIGESLVAVSDGHCSGNLSFKGFGLTLSAPDDAAAEQLFVALSDGGQVVMPMTKTFFSPGFGMVNDRFGVLWLIMVT